MAGERLAPGTALREEFRMRQGYISVHPTVRIREEALTGGDTQYILCFKSAGTLAREEIERPIDQELFRQLEQKIIAKPLIGKLRRSYALGETHLLEVNRVDQGQPTEFWYAEVEFDTVEDALTFRPQDWGLEGVSLPGSYGPAGPEHGGLLGKDPGLRSAVHRGTAKGRALPSLCFGWHFSLGMCVLGAAVQKKGKKPRPSSFCHGE